MAFLKLLLKRINEKLSQTNKRHSVWMWSSVFKWDHQYTLAKNLLKLMNKTLVGLNKYQVFKSQYILWAAAIATGYLFSQIDNFILSVRLDHQDVVKGVVVDKVLKNQIIKEKLKQALNLNVFQNQDIQLSLHYLLMYKVLEPQMPQINKLVKYGITQALQSQSVIQYCKDQAAETLQKQKQFIQKQTFWFLNSEIMQNIVKNGLVAVLKGQLFQNLMSSNFIYASTTQLYNNQNKQKAYDFLRQKIV